MSQKRYDIALFTDKSQDPTNRYIYDQYVLLGLDDSNLGTVADRVQAAGYPKKAGAADWNKGDCKCRLMPTQVWLAVEKGHLVPDEWVFVPKNYLEKWLDRQTTMTSGVERQQIQSLLGNLRRDGRLTQQEIRDVFSGPLVSAGATIAAPDRILAARIAAEANAAVAADTGPAPLAIIPPTMAAPAVVTPAIAPPGPAPAVAAPAVATPAVVPPNIASTATAAVNTPAPEVPDSDDEDEGDDSDEGQEEEASLLNDDDLMKVQDMPDQPSTDDNDLPLHSESDEDAEQDIPNQPQNSPPAPPETNPVVQQPPSTNPPKLNKRTKPYRSNPSLVDPLRQPQPYAQNIPAPAQAAQKSTNSVQADLVVEKERAAGLPEIEHFKPAADSMSGSQALPLMSSEWDDLTKDVERELEGKFEVREGEARANQRGGGSDGDGGGGSSSDGE